MIPLLRQPSRGFSLIEVIVALVVISSFGAALFVWAGQTLQTASRGAQVQQQAEVERNITELAFALNPVLQPSGEWMTPTYRYRWSAVPSVGPADQVRLIGSVSPWQVVLYKVQFTVAEIDTDRATADAPWVSERLVAGYRGVRPRLSGPPGFSAPKAAP